MPITIPPPDVERRPRRSGEDDGGHGRRPPNNRDLKRTGGGGDNDNWGNRPGRPRRAGQRLITYRLGLFFALGAVFLFFTGLVSVFSVTQAAGRLDIYNRNLNTWLPTAIPPVLWLNTAILLLSSVTVEFARRHMFHSIDAMEEWFGLGKPTSRRALPWLLATLFLGSLFLAGQVLAWSQLTLQGLSFQASGNGGHSFYILTCAHAVHLVAGILSLVAAVVGLVAFRSVEDRQILVDCAAWYWHAMTALWLCLFTLLAIR
ncbi:MAG TPA: cytochrome c oxidase subunit 3 [Acidobacteriaceae bacterium]|jgi:cytochrome c oxidase subunit 3|nr:cytochrome c oxidase subunit 3 [Acidobacteriaceae bacterium]